MPSKRKEKSANSRFSSKKHRKTTSIPIDSVQFNCLIRNDLESDDLARMYSGNSVDSIKDRFRVLDQPFKCVFIDNLIEDHRFVDSLEKEIRLHVRFNEKNNDLYRFKQSRDFKHLQHLPHCQAMTDCLLEQLMPVLRKVTGFQLYEDCIDVTASKYDKNDVLNCHDDMLEERRIAFILYLVDQEWTEADGGHLCLFGRDETNQPVDEPMKFLPKRNTMVFFEVTPNSFHQVSEVLSDRTRLSVNGWFRGPRCHQIAKEVEPFDLPIKFDDHIVDESNLRRWINPLYLTDEIQAQIKGKFENESQISLADFIDPELFKQVEAALQECQSWVRCGPYNRRSFEKLSDQSLPKMVKELIDVMTSEAMFLTLGNVTGLKLHPMNPDEEEGEEEDEEVEEEEEDDSEDDSDGDNCKPIVNDKTAKHKTFDPRCQLQIGKFSRGSYTLIHDFDGEVLDKDAKLDVYLHFGHPFECQFQDGGFIEYVEKRGDDHLLTVEPKSNHLSVVYRDGKTLRFMKYLNNAHPGDFYQISLVFKE